MTSADTTAEQRNDPSVSMSDRVADPVPAGSCHPGAPSSSRPNNDYPDGDPRCVTLVTTLVEATESLTLPFTAAAATELVSLVIALRSLDTVLLDPWPSHAEMAAHVEALRQRLAGGGDMLLTELVTLVVHHLRTEVAAGTVADSTAVVYVEHLTRLVEFCARQGTPITTVAQFEAARATIAHAWVRSDGRNRKGQPTPAGANVQNLRRTVGYTAWAVLRQHGLSSIDAFRGVDVDRPAPTGRTQPFTREQRDAVALMARSLNQDPLMRQQEGHVLDGVREAVIVALALSGATVGDIAAMRVHHVDLDEGTVLLPGTGKNRARLIHVAPWVATYLALRLEELAAFNPGLDVASLPLVSRTRRNAAVSPLSPSAVGMRLNKIFALAGLSHLTGTGMRLWAARYAYDHGPGPAVIPADRPAGARDLVAAAHVLGTTVSGAATALGIDPYYSLTRPA